MKRNFWRHSVRRKICPRSHSPMASNGTRYMQRGNLIGILIRNTKICTSPPKITVLGSVEYTPQILGPHI